MNKPHHNLLRDILYFVAISDVDKESIRQVKQVFELDDFVDKKSAIQMSGVIGDAELAVIEQLKTELEALREVWNKVSNDINFDHMAEEALVDLDNVLITHFNDKLGVSLALTQKLSQVVVVDLFAALQQASVVLRDDASKVNRAALIEVAAALHLIEGSLSQYAHLDAGHTQNLLSEIQRLEAVAAGTAYNQLETYGSGQLDRDTLTAVVKDIKASLKIVEQALDTFFRKPTEKSSLALAPKPLKQVSGIFEMLGLVTPMGIVDASHYFIQYFQQDDYKVNQAEFELVAESLSMVGLYTDEMPKVRPESEQALEGALQRLKSTLENAGIDATKLAEQAPAVAEDAGGVEEAKNQVTTISATESEASEEKILDQAFDAELLDIYLTEAEEVIAYIAQNLQALRVNATDHAPLTEMRRSYHTLKGSGRTVGLVALGEVAAQVEMFLNAVLDAKTNLNQGQIANIEEITAAFAAWATELKANNQVYIHQAHWLRKIAALPVITEAETKTEIITTKAKPEAHVLIAGTRKLSRALYDIFLNESMQNITILEQNVAKIAENKAVQPDKVVQRAIHTLASNALATGFAPMGDLCRALEGWVTQTKEGWTAQHLDLYSNVVKTIATMWQKISELKNPRSAQALIKLLNGTASQTEPENEPNANLVETLQEEVATDTSADAANMVVEYLEDDPVEATPAPVNAFADLHVKAPEVDQDLLSLFIDEAHEILPEIGSELRAWRASPKSKNHPEALQRSLHTLKGSARMAGQLALGDIAHGFEEQVVQALKQLPTAENFESMFVDLDKIGSYFERTVEGDSEQTTKTSLDEMQSPGRSIDRKAQFLRMRADTLDRLINEAGEISIIRSRMDRELVGFKQSSNDLTDSIVRLRNYLRELEIEAETQMQSRMNIMQEANENFDPLEFDRFTRLQELTRMIAESVNDVGTIQHGLLSNLDQTEAALQQQSRMNRDLQQGLLGARMLPFRQIVDRMQRIVRQTARELNKSVNLVIQGEATEIDRSVLDKLGAPLEHLLRNAVAHGIELPSERKKQGKLETGTITLNLRRQNDEIRLSVSDDGAGINLDKVKEKAIKNKLLSRDKEVTEQALLSVIFEPGFSTSEKVSQIAGRGVGLDVVRNDISGLGGRVDLASEFSKGAVFNIYLPVTQSVAQVLLVRAGEGIYALPVAMIEQAQKIKRNELLAAYSAGEIKWAGSKYPLHHLAKLLNQQDHEVEDTNYTSILLLRSGAYTVALHVDEVMGNQEVVVKPIGVQLARVPGMVGATVAGNGNIVMIINPVQIANREVLTAGNVSVKAVKAVKRAAAKAVVKLRALVVDDSLTMRKVLGRLLEREGYEVLVAKDGMDAMQLLQETTPDIILTDIEMPRMDGFGLSRNIRDDARTANTPLIMISSRTADKHQSLATEIGVDAFFGKPVHDEELVGKMKELLAARNNSFV
ncbi:MAG: Hpt domain-containing protein [Methylophilaceae bacterium]